MSKNLIPEIAKMLGVELGEEFKIKGDKGFEDKTFYLTIRGLKAKLDQYPKKELPAMAALDSLLFGDTEIIKLPWKPKKGELVYTFCFCIGSNDKWTVTWRHWENRVEEIALLKAGWIYRSRAEAERALQDVAVEEGVKSGL